MWTSSRCTRERVLLSKKEISNGEQLPLKQVGWNLPRGEFTLTAGQNPGGTVLFKGPITFLHQQPARRPARVLPRRIHLFARLHAPARRQTGARAVEGDNKSTRLYVTDGELT